MALISRRLAKPSFESGADNAYVGLRKVGLPVFESIVFAMVAAFLGLRLYAVLGKRTGHEQSITKPADESAALQKVAVPAEDQRDPAPARIVDIDPLEPVASAGIRSIAAADPRFNPSDFVEGAKSAYRLILEAYWSGDEETIAKFANDEVRDAFSEVIAARKAAGETLDNRLVSIERAVISHAELDRKTARVTVRFDADIAAVTRSADGKVLAGSLTDAVPTHDEWTFERQIRSSDPSWTLVDTDEAA
jgi:predicted lipid-binding transport protein (Tim44 family)